ncbi:MAG: tetratricopeptide repeat protein [Pseudomonadota bacterium]
MSDELFQQLTPGAGIELYDRVVGETHSDCSLCGRELGDYRLTSFIATGGMSTVYRAERADGRFDREVALKISTSAAVDERYRQRFLTEQKVLATLNHPNIAQLYDVGVSEEGWPFIVMEFIDGTPVDEYVDASSLSLNAVIDLLIATGRALAFAHNRLIVHRDIKPSNVLVDTSGAPKLLDFGIAKQLDDAVLTVTHGPSPLTPRFASPEQLANKPVTVASDVYQLGVLAVSLLHKAPWGPDSLETAAKHLVQGTSEPLPDELLESLPRDLTAVLQTAVEVDPQRRYSTVAEFVDDLEAWRDGYPVSARRVTAVYRAQRFIRRNVWPVSVTAFALIALILGSVSYTVSLGESRRAAEQAAQQAEAINEFLVDMMKRSSPSQGGRADLSARELLANAADQVGELDEHKGIQAAVQQVLSEVYLELGDTDLAEGLLEQALANRQESDAPAHDLAATMMGLGIVDYNRNDYLAALEHYEQTQELLLQEYQRDDAELIRPQHLMGNALVRLGRIDEAETIVREVLALRRRHLGPLHNDIAVSLNTLGLLTSWRGEPDEAEGYFLEAMDQLERTNGQQTLTYPGLLQNYAHLLSSRGDAQKALEFQLEALSAYQDYVEGDSYWTADSLSSVADAYLNLEDYETAIEYCLLSIAMYRRLDETPSSSIFSPLVTVAHLYYLTNQLDAAIAAGEESLELLTSTLGEEHWRVGYVMINHARHSQSLVGTEVAARQLQQGLELIQRSDMAGSIVEAEGIQRLGELYESSGDLQAALQEFHRALAVAETASPDAAFTNELRRKTSEATAQLAALNRSLDE